MDIIYDPGSGGGGNTGGGTSAGSSGSYHPGVGGSPQNPGDKYYTQADYIHNAREEFLSSTPNTVAPIVVELPDEHFVGGADAIFDIFGTDLDNIENPYSDPYIVGFDERTETTTLYPFTNAPKYNSDVSEEFQYTVYEAIEEFSPAYYEFEKALDEAKRQKAYALSSMADSKNSSSDYSYNQSLATSIANQPSSLLNGTNLITLEFDTDNWTITFKFNYLGGTGFDYSRVTYRLERNDIYLGRHIDGSMYDWYAGGRLYDAPRAGNELFNETGDLNTVRFLGFEDKNYNFNLKQKKEGMAEVYKMLGVNAGTRSASEQSPMSLLYLSRLSQAKEELTLEEYDRGMDGLYHIADYQVSTASCSDLSKDGISHAFCEIDSLLHDAERGIHDLGDAIAQGATDAANDAGDFFSDVFGW